MRANVTVEDMNGEWIVAFSRADHELLDVMKEVVPQSGRRWDAKNHHWRITSSARVMADLCTTFEKLGAAVAKPGTLTRHRPDDNDRGSAEYWENGSEPWKKPPVGSINLGDSPKLVTACAGDEEGRSDLR